ncbi:Acyl-CoA reductase or other NAD-dependent aldehyde dehydrogenase [Geosmithia morbida]|uniref:Acyl-CoA reductase or other NAD-dependent aldehyde dehydrogenase n=1 Tax=Geosmithia morbida TaxID=1094350 RepID=A0A9P4Z1X2_9HYPO|nr:Acyl-CoA reductase or other NAD-dependent aldehyde dehydrogenase [Geosmithia morbida]KAF4125906.1 Acyl-CoA reductase or other NAD-dependent aldehyde dehydrogenase [Geosmithia morbida]
MATVPLFINGKEEESSATFDVVSPYTKGTCWRAASATPRDAVRAVEAAEAAFPAWSRTKPTDRRDVLLRAADLLEQRLDECAGYMRTEMGADVGASQFFVVPLSIRMLRDLAGRITSICGSVPVVEQEGQSAMIVKEAMGVVLGIVPWNAPYVFGIRAAACALATGNTTVLKSSEMSPRCYWAIARAFHDAGLPDGCLNVISCRPQDAPAVVDAMIDHPAVRKVNFTGSTAVGRKVAKKCGEALKPCLMELGGKNSSIVCADADLERALREVMAGSFLNSGQICMATDRVILHKDIAPAFMTALGEALKVAAQEQPPLTLVSSASKERVAKLVSDALSSGAQLISGPLDSDATQQGVRLNRVLVGHVKEHMAIWNDESFAPVAACMVVESDDEAVTMANRGGYGLSAAVFTEDLRKGFALARRIESGAVHINSMTIHDEPVLPHGGVKNSGWGRFNGTMGLDEFLVTKSITWND